MTTKSQNLKTARAFIATCCFAILLWFTGIIALTLIFEPVQEVIIIGTEKRNLKAVKRTDVKILNGPANYLTVRGQQPGFVKKLYQNGAWLVIPGKVTGCISPDSWLNTAKN